MGSDPHGCGQSGARAKSSGRSEVVRTDSACRAGAIFQRRPHTRVRNQEMGGGVYIMSDNGWQSAFLVTNDGVIVFDAPESFGKSIPTAIAKITDKPIKILIYSHIHKDHIGGAGAFKDIKDLKIVATEGVAEFLNEQRDRNRPVPNVVFGATKPIAMGG